MNRLEQRRRNVFAERPAPCFHRTIDIVKSQRTVLKTAALTDDDDKSLPPLSPTPFSIEKVNEKECAVCFFVIEPGFDSYINKGRMPVISIAVTRIENGSNMEPMRLEEQRKPKLGALTRLKSIILNKRWNLVSPFSRPRFSNGHNRESSIWMFQSILPVILNL
ncbi:hypothetical protein O9G_004202 [Rozella allomycis CSF55]|uniref:Uncharacterized protein n=1 Tax=Rozella allomycis (strain CSF55) TaxID=988480 RepID=A0A075B2L4_ROZAC|nr:hypothetical protein O9G_004202 [Rozella allomycis CSF55]|eukprot:EPZ35191.1 hypothetical protein O9G_004202 [Rozella allomycis CSF55]